MRRSPILALGIVAACVNAASSHADTCGGEAIEARGEPSRFLWLAKTKTRANWRVKVRGTPGLGADYANWARAQNTDERCYSGPTGHVCIFTGVPCKP